MKLAGEYRIPASMQQVWDALNDPEVLKACIPGCEELEKQSDTELTAIVKQKIGPVSARFTGNVVLKDMNPPSSYRIEGSGSAGAAGGASGGANVQLTSEGDVTVLTYDVDAKVTGKIAQLGQRLINPVAKKLANQFFENFNDHMGGSEAGVATSTVGETATSVAAAAAAIVGGDAEMASGHVEGVKAAASDALHKAEDAVSHLANEATSATAIESAEGVVDNAREAVAGSASKASDKAQGAVGGVVDGPLTFRKVVVIIAMLVVAAVIGATLFSGS